ncbi:MAG TPA: ester cyclase [Dehalococcoidia bacterium]
MGGWERRRDLEFAADGVSGGLTLWPYFHFYRRYIIEHETVTSPADRIDRIRGLAGASELPIDVDTLLTQISALPNLSPVSAQLREFAERYTEAWCSQNAASLAACYSPNGSLTINYGTPSVGSDAITEAAQGFMTAFPDMVVLMDHLLNEAARPVYCWTLIGTNTGPGGTGKRVRIGGFEIWKVGTDGLIAESLGHFDGVAYQYQLEHGVEDVQ